MDSGSAASRPFASRDIKENVSVNRDVNRAALCDNDARDDRVEPDRRRAASVSGGLDGPTFRDVFNAASDPNSSVNSAAVRGSLFI